MSSNTATGSILLTDRPAERVLRLTLNRPDKRNALSDGLRAALFGSLRQGDADPDTSVIIVRGAGSCFSAGYDLSSSLHPVERPGATHADGWWPRHVAAGWFELADMATPIVAQVHGHCLAGASELAAACDLVYIADDAQVGYPPVRLMSPPDFAWQPWLLGWRAGMEALLTGDPISGQRAVELGFANRAVPAADLDAAVLDVATRISKVPAELLAINKRAVHRSMEIAGYRSAVRSCTELQSLAFHQEASLRYRERIGEVGLRRALDERDAPFGDYRTTTPDD